jgi:hypothetical protein
MSRAQQNSFDRLVFHCERPRHRRLGGVGAWRRSKTCVDSYTVARMLSLTNRMMS